MGRALCRLHGRGGLTAFLAALAVFLLAGAPPLFAQRVKLEARYVGEKDSGKEAEKKEKAPKKAEKNRYFALRGGRVHTVTGPVLEKADILVKNGVIAEIGRDLPLPEGCTVLDVHGMQVYPGLVAVNSSGILGREPPENTTDLFGLNMVLALSGGLTTVVTGNTAAKLTYGTTQGMVVKRNLFLFLRYSRRFPAKRRELRADLERVRRYLRDLEVYEAAKSAGDKETKEPDKGWLKGKYENYRKLLQGAVTARMSANSAQEIRDACELAERFGFPLVLDGGTEAWILPDEIARAGAKLVITPRRKAYRDRRKNAPSGWNIESARILHDHGVCFAILPASGGISLGGITGRDLMALPLEAAFAVRGGLSDADALRAITIDAARVLGLEHRLGSIETGKDGDFVVCRGDLLHYATLVEYTVVNGRVVYDKEKESLFAHIRPRSGSEDRGKVIDFWPRPFGEEAGGEAASGESPDHGP